MVDFNTDIPKGKPKLDSKYWENFNNKETRDSVLSDFNTNRALEDISIFKGGKK